MTVAEPPKLLLSSSSDGGRTGIELDAASSTEDHRDSGGFDHHCAPESAVKETSRLTRPI